MVRKIIAFIIGTLIVSQVCAETVLVLTPNTCVIKGNEICEVKMNVAAKLNSKNRMLCISAPELKIMHCSTQTNNGIELNLNIEIERSTQFMLIDKHSKEVLSSGYFSVVKYQPTVTRKRRSFAWSFNDGR